MVQKLVYKFNGSDFEIVAVKFYQPKIKSMEIIDLILSGDLDINFYLLSIELIIAVAFMFLKLRLWLKVALLLLTCLNLYLAFLYVNHFLCVEKLSEMYEAIAFLGLIYLCSGFLLSTGFRMIIRVYKRLKLKKHVRDSE